MDTLAALHFLRPAWLWLLLPYALLSLLHYRRQNGPPRWQGAIAPHLVPYLMIRGRRGGALSPFGVSLLLSPLLVIALAGPSWQRGASPFAQDGAALVIAVDLSQSMADRDLQPDRLQRARGKLLELIALRGDAPTALVAYAGTAHTVLPLTDDRSLLLYYLDALQVGMLPREGKRPEAAIPLARALIEASGGAGTLLLVGDGATNASAAPFRTLADDSRLQLLVWGMGKTRAALIEDAAQGRDSGAQPLQEAQLRALAEAANGYYQPFTVDGQDLSRLARRIDRHFLVSEDSSRPWIDGGYRLLWPVMALFLLWFRRGWVLAW